MYPFHQLLKQKHIRRMLGNIFIMLSIISSKRTLGVIYLCVLLIIFNIIIKYVINSLIVFCVIYTISDLYKKRKKYIWIVKIVSGNIRFLSYTIIGETTINNILCIKPNKVRTIRPKKI
jgi:hypothetical protein